MWLKAGALALGVLCIALTVQPPVRVYRESDMRPVLLRPAVARTISRPFLPLLLDLYWLRALNAIGEEDSERKNRGLYEYALVITELDPRFYEVYKYLGLNIPYEVDRNKWVNVELSSDLFRRGLKVFPDDLKLHLYLGYNLFSLERKFREASDVFLAGSRCPGAPDFMAPFATRLLAHDGSAEAALALARELAESATDEESRQEFQTRALELEVEVVLQRVDKAVARFTEEQQRGPKDMEELKAKGYWDGPMEDPHGEKIVIGYDGKVRSGSFGGRRVEVHEK